MDFFKAQEQAKRSTGILVLLFAAAVITLVVFTNIIAMAALGYLNLEADSEVNLQYLLSQFDWRMFGFVTTVVGFVIFSGSAYKQISLRQGGKVIAEAMGGVAINPALANRLEKRLLNVVEEMAIAAGTPVPRIYLMKDEPGINAFAAGFTSADAVIGITQGAIEKLDRDELQGVIAHEFSHILNGDMRLNLQVLALLHGILVIGFIGYYLLHAGRGNSKNGAAIFGLGFGLILIGYGGHFFGNIIKASISRQREYLADASAVQFTRNNQGITQALYKIRQSSYGSYIEQPDAIEYTHGFFSTGVKSFASRLFATHPPLDDRISKISPHFLLNQANADHKPMRKVSKTKSANDTSKGSQAEKSYAGFGVEQVAILSVLSQAGNIDQQQLDYAHTLINNIDDTLYAASHNVVGARAIVCCLLLSKTSDVLTKQLAIIRSLQDTQLIDSVFALRNEVDVLPIGYRLPLVDLLNPALKQLSATQIKQFKDLVDSLSYADQQLDRFEWILQQVVFNHIDNRATDAGVKKYLSISKASVAVNGILSLVLAATEHQLSDANHNKLQQFTDLTQLEKLQSDATDYQRASEYLDTLNRLGFGDKEKVLRGCLFIISIDGICSIKEYELVRAIADVLRVPLPGGLSIGPIS
ncbi:heat-shock protein HtpX [Thalassotalea litorea]|uniref:Heat-shock protein HtpX n=1 Tax=Thalassotalea litorea TaxID=2020715 RepID=A0A5R9IP20_9GAMM|nr:M48 family metallopeptidase [Thalassotalea litorea]TLU66213.1 heat-shock protein HtpX [Thalassotalea litorea]